MLLGFELVSNPHILACVYWPCVSNSGGDLVFICFGRVWYCLGIIGLLYQLFGSHRPIAGFSLHPMDFAPFPVLI